MKTIITVWVCSTSLPLCTPAQDPTGPPLVLETQLSNVQCEATFASVLALARVIVKDGIIYVARHTCVSGQAL